MHALPVELVLQGREVLVVGPFAEAAGKVERLLDAGAKVTVISESAPTPDLLALTDRVELLERAAVDADLADKALVYVGPWATPDDEARARRWHADALQRGALFCAIDRPETSTFTNVGVVRASGLTLTISSGGKSPGLVRRLREDLEQVLGDARLGRLVEALAARRAKLPRGERAGPMAEAIRGFALRASLVFPPWFERDDGEASR